MIYFSKSDKTNDSRHPNKYKHRRILLGNCRKISHRKNQTVSGMNSGFRIHLALTVGTVTIKSANDADKSNLKWSLLPARDMIVLLK